MSGKNEMETYGILLLDGITFDKVVPSPQNTVVLLVYNKREVGDYGTDSIREDYFNFATEAQRKGDSDNVLFAQLIVNGAQNSGVAARLDMEPNFRHPKMFLFKPGNAKPIEYPSTSPFNFVALSQFVSKHSSFHIRTPGTIQAYNELVAKLLAGVESGKEIIEQGEALVNSFKTELKDNAEQYVKLMKKYVEKGTDYIESEIKRLKSILDSDKISEKKKREIREKLNVVYQFDKSDVKYEMPKESDEDIIIEVKPTAHEL
jgi:hypothetical protein